jgi:hypothetical protein
MARPTGGPGFGHRVGNIYTVEGEALCINFSAIVELTGIEDEILVFLALSIRPNSSLGTRKLCI